MVRVVRDMVLPNLVWRAGRVAAAIRTTAVSCLWALLQSSVFTVDKVGVFCSCSICVTRISSVARTQLWQA